MRGRFRQSSIFFYCADRLHASSSMRVDFPIVSSKRDGTAFCSSHLALDLLVEWRDGCLESGPALPASAFGRSSPIRGGGFSLLPFALGFIHRPFCSPPCVASHLDAALFPSRPPTWTIAFGLLSLTDPTRNARSFPFDVHVEGEA